MPAPFPSTFASAAAGTNITDAGSGCGSTRGDGSAGDWSRPRMNGATQTFRRPSQATSFSQTSQTANPTSSSTSGVYVPPHQNPTYQPYSTRTANGADARYSKEQLLELFKSQKDAGNLGKNISELFVGDWDPERANGTSHAWGRKDEAKEIASGPGICWDNSGNILPLGTIEMTDEEKENFSTTVNSPLKPPPQKADKDSAAGGSLTSRKASISQGQGPSSRPGNRRRDTGEYGKNVLSSPPSGNKYSRDEQSGPNAPPLLRRRTDLKESHDDREKSKGGPESPMSSSSPFGTFKRSATGPFSATGNGPSSPWSATSPSTGGFGAFGNFAIGSSGQAAAPSEKKAGFGSVRGESRFKGIMGRDSSEDLASQLKEKISANSLDKLQEADMEQGSQGWGRAQSGRPLSGETDPFGDEDVRAGSAALGGGEDMSPPHPSAFGMGTPSRQIPSDDHGFSAFGMSADIPGLRGQHGAHDTSYHPSNEPMSPTDTNPYQSPGPDRDDSDEVETNGSDIQNAQLQGLVGLGGTQQFGSLGQQPRGVSTGYEASDRSQTSSVGANRGFPGLPGLGGLGGLGGGSPWSAAPAPIGTPNRERGGMPGAFGDSIFGGMGDLQSPSLGAIGGSGVFGSSGTPTLSGTGTIGRGSKLGSLFPQAMQEQMRAGDSGRQSGEEPDEARQGFANMAPGPGAPRNDTDSPLRANKGMFDDLFSSQPFGQAQRSDSRGAQGQGVAQAPSNQPPTSQQRTMVMPDRMRWIYKDPQGNTQGPWSGLEMHDWYKAGFFSPELLVRKYEDPDYEPLAQLIRRIGNSREPFLVPQIGIPHGPPSTQAPGPTGPGTTTGGPGAAQPPFASLFPSFGTTLTAEQQNALERRKQEEQYLMARQKEHLAQQQVMVKQQMQHMQGPHPIFPQQLHHHSSAHSLHSQPSFGSITSPAGYQPSPTQGPVQAPGNVPGFFDRPFRPNVQAGSAPLSAGVDPLSGVREEDIPALLERLNLTRSGQFGMGPGPFGQQPGEGPPQSQQIVNILEERARLQREQLVHDAMQQNTPGEHQAGIDRLQQFQQLRDQLDQEEMGNPPEGVIGKPIAPPSSQHQQEIHAQHQQQSLGGHRTVSREEQPHVEKDPEPLSLAQQVQKAAMAKQSPASQPHSPWEKVEAPVQPFPPPPSTSPLPAPAAQRNRQNVADALAAESRSRSQTPYTAEIPSTSIAPWAKETVETSKGPSLKEIQELEAKKAAQQEEIAAAARRALLEQERLQQAAVQTAPPAPAPGLPSTANWAKGTTPVTPTFGSASPWFKAATGKVPTPAAGPAGKKTLQQIQKEEEARKQKAAAATAGVASVQGAPAVAAIPAGKRYADLASKVAPPNAQGSGAWTTVGASGKPRVPTGPAAVPTAPRTAASGVVPTLAAKPKNMPAAPQRSTTLGGPIPGQPSAADEFTKWCKSALSKGLNSNINVDDFVQQLLTFPPEAEIISESVYANSQTMDGRRFAEEFLRRRKLADKGIIDTTSAGQSFSPSNESNKSTGGWSEVAKKNPTAAKEEANSAFKVVSAKKKGKR